MWKQLRNWVMDRTQRNFEIYAREKEKHYISINRTLKVNLVETQKEKSYRESFNLLRENPSKPEQNVDRNINILMRFQTEMRIVLLETGGRANLITKWQRT